MVGGGRGPVRPRKIDNASRLSTSHDDGRNRITQKPRVSRGRSRRRPPLWLAALPYCIGRAIVDRGTSAGDQQERDAPRREGEDCDRSACELGEDAVAPHVLSGTWQKKGARAPGRDQPALERRVRQSVRVHRHCLQRYGLGRDPWSESPKHADDLAEDRHGRAPRVDDDRRHRRMLGLEHDPLPVTRKALDRRLGLARLRLHERDHDVVGRRVVLPPHEHEIAVADVRLDHAFAAYAEREQLLGPAGQRGGGDVQLPLAVLGCEQRLPGGNTAEDRHRVRGARRRIRQRQRPGRPSRAHPPLQRALALERPQVVERRSRRDLEPVADLPDGGRHAVLRDERAHEAEDLLLLVGQLAHDTSLAGYDTQRVLRKASKKRGWSYAGSQGSQTGQVLRPCSRASVIVFMYTRSASGIRATQSQSRRWKSRESRCAQYGSPCSTVSVPTATGRSVVSGAIGSVSDGNVGEASVGVEAYEDTGGASGSLMCRFVSTVDRNSSLARRNSRSARPTIRPSSGNFDGPKTSSASTPMTSIS